MGYFLQIPIVGLVSFFLVGAIAVVCYEWLLRQTIRFGASTVVGLAAGALMSLLIALMTLIESGLHTLEFTVAITTFPLLVSVLSIVGAWLGWLFLRFLK